MDKGIISGDTDNVYQ